MKFIEGLWTLRTIILIGFLAVLIYIVIEG